MESCQGPSRRVLGTSKLKGRTAGLQLGNRSQGRLGEEDRILFQLRQVLRGGLEHGAPIVLPAPRLLAPKIVERAASRHRIAFSVSCHPDQDAGGPSDSQLVDGLHDRGGHQPKPKPKKS